MGQMALIIQHQESYLAVSNSYPGYGFDTKKSDRMLAPPPL
jgi:hypothetical protein